MGAIKYLNQRNDKPEVRPLYSRVPETLHDRLAKASVKHKMSQNSLVITALKYFLDSLEKENKKKTGAK